MLSVNEMVWSSTSQGKLGIPGSLNATIHLMGQKTINYPSSFSVFSPWPLSTQQTIYFYSIYTKNAHNISRFVNSVTIINDHTEEPGKP